ncbi:rCG60550 [Rattus norvegicus]|uniref:RCG60550 n=1 Tax=Rattus norvegicus TaxID=10116 RepID=A6JJT9_RAT|nr:rCG60550 [Rattus norvegicus]
MYFGPFPVSAQIVNLPRVGITPCTVPNLYTLSQSWCSINTSR